MDKATFQYVFGPVPSRRLGRSLGVDVVPFKHCTFDCVYCQLGRTTCRDLERREFVPLADVVAEIEQKLDAGAAPDHITLAGSGEPTLYARLGDLIAAIKARTATPVAVLTNGSLLWDPEVRRDLVEADIVMPSLDAADGATFERVNRPHPDLDFDRVVAGLAAFRAEFTKPIWLEVFLLAQTTDADAEKLAALVQRIAPDRIQLNTVHRPPTESDALAMPRDRLERLAALFGEKAEVIADFSAARAAGGCVIASEDILAMLRRRPCSLEDIAAGLGAHRAEVAKHLDRLVAEETIQPVMRGGTVYYLANPA